MNGKLLKALSSLVKMGLTPIIVFLTCFFILTYPAVTRFRTHFFTGLGDGFQNVWNIWWVVKAVTVLHENPWYTNYLHYPYGTSLVGHTLNPFNGFMAVILSPFMSIVSAHNVTVTFSFVMAGLTTFWLAHYLTSAYWPSLIAGFIFTFSSFHFAHAEGHLQLVSLEWIPLFVLLWLRLVLKPTVLVGAAAAVTLFFVILCDYYYFFYCVITGIIILCWFVVREKKLSGLADTRRLIALGTFTLISLFTSGILAGSVLLLNFRDPLVGAHPTLDFSLDLLAPFIYGGHWRFASLTRFYWARLPGNISESCVYLGWSVIILLIYAWKRRGLVGTSEFKLFLFLLCFFLVAALGPTLQVGGKRIFEHRLVLPYALLQLIFPPLKLSGVPVRMMVMVFLASAIISAFSLKLLFQGSKPERALALALICLLVVEYLPQPISTSKVPVPGYVNAIAVAPGNGGVLDTISDATAALFYQTLHERPLALGYLARVPASVDRKDHHLEELIQDERFDRLWPDYRLRYVVASPRILGDWPDTKTIWSDGQVGIFDVTQSTERFDRILRDSPENSMDQSPAACEGAIDRINDLSPRSPHLAISKTLSVAGWLAAVPENGIAADAMFVTLLSESGKRLYIEARTRPRPDVLEHFKQPNMPDPGYIVHSELSELSGRYDLGLSLVYQGKLRNCRQFDIPLVINH